MHPNIVPIKCLSSKEFNDFVSLVERFNELNTYCPVNYLVAVRSNNGDLDGPVWVDVWSDSPSRIGHIMDEWANLVKSFYELERKYIGTENSPLSFPNGTAGLNNIFSEILFTPNVFDVPPGLSPQGEDVTPQFVLRKQPKKGPIKGAILWLKSIFRTRD